MCEWYSCSVHPASMWNLGITLRSNTVFIPGVVNPYSISGPGRFSAAILRVYGTAAAAYAVSSPHFAYLCGKNKVLRKRRQVVSKLDGHHQSHLKGLKSWMSCLQALLRAPWWTWLIHTLLREGDWRSVIEISLSSNTAWVRFLTRRAFFPLRWSEKMCAPFERWVTVSVIYKDAGSWHKPKVFVCLKEENKMVAGMEVNHIPVVKVSPLSLVEVIWSHLVNFVRDVSGWPSQN